MTTPIEIRAAIQARADKIADARACDTGEEYLDAEAEILGQYREDEIAAYNLYMARIDGGI